MQTIVYMASYCQENFFHCGRQCRWCTRRLVNTYSGWVDITIPQYGEIFLRLGVRVLTKDGNCPHSKPYWSGPRSFVRSAKSAQGHGLRDCGEVTQLWSGVLFVLGKAL